MPARLRARYRCVYSTPLLLAFLALVAGSPAPLHAQTVRPSDLPVIDGPPPPQPPDVISRDASGRATIRAVRIHEEIKLDGKLDEEIYRTTPAMSDFIQQEPYEGQPATEKTDVWILFDDRNLYVSAICWDSHPERMVSNELRRDNANVTQNENFVADIDTFYDRRSGFFFETNPLGAVRDGLIMNERDANWDWNAVWDVRSTVFEKGWMMEMQIPFKSLRYKAGREQVWGMVIRRTIKWKNEDTFLTAIPASYGWRGIYKFSSAATLVGLEAPPAALNLELKPYAIGGLKTDRNATPAISNDFTRDAGFDAKYGLTRGLTADFTYNTDFAQVEEDDQQVNLTRFSLFFPEKREFFLEGQGLFDFGGGASSDGPPTRTPLIFFSRQIGLKGGQTVPIRVGGRMTGRAGPYSVGILNIETGEAEAVAATPTNFSVVRLRRDVFKRSTIGMVATNRSPGAGPSGSSQAYGVDANFALSQNVEARGYYARTRAPNQTGETSSYRGLFNYTGDRYGLIYEHLLVGPDFNPEIGFLRRSDFRRNYGQARFSPRPKSGQVRKYTSQASLDYITDSAGRLETREAQGLYQMDFQSSDSIVAAYTNTYELLKKPFAIAKGVTLPVGGYSFDDLSASYRLGAQHRVSGSLNVKYGTFYDGHRTEAGFSSGRIEVTRNLSIEPRLSLSWVDLSPGSFVATLASARANYTITPRMATAALFQYNSSNNATSTSVRFRWEYQPGSDLFVVFTEGRDTTLGGFPALQNRGVVVKFTRLFRL